MMPDAPVMPMIIRFMQGPVRSMRRASGAALQGVVTRCGREGSS